MADQYTVRFEERALDLAHLERLVASAARFAETHHRAQWNLLSDANRNVVSLCTGRHDLLPAIARQARAGRLLDVQQGIDLPNQRPQFFIGPMSKPVEVIKSKRKSKALRAAAEAPRCCGARLPPRVCLLQYTYTTPKAIMAPGKHFLPETDLTRCLRAFDDKIFKKSRGKKRSYEKHLMFNFVKAGMYTVQQVADKGDAWFKKGQAQEEVVGFTNKTLWKHIKKTASEQLKQRELLFKVQLEEGQLAAAEAAERRASAAVDGRNGTDQTYAADEHSDVDGEETEGDGGEPLNEGDGALEAKEDQVPENEALHEALDSSVKDVADVSSTNELIENYQETKATENAEVEVEEVKEKEKDILEKIKEKAAPGEANVSATEEDETTTDGEDPNPSEKTEEDETNEVSEAEESKEEFLPELIDEDALRESIVPEGMTTEPEANAMFASVDLVPERDPKHVVYICRDNEDDAKPRQKGKLVSMFSARGKVIFVRKILHDMPHLSLLQAEQFRDNLLDENRQVVEVEETQRTENEIYRVAMPWVVFGSYCIGTTWYLVMDLRPDPPHRGAWCRTCKRCCTTFCLSRCCGGCGCGCCVYTKTADSKRMGVV